MSERLYLIRIDMERFLGPMSLKEMRESYRRMEFGLQDELASSNKLWVTFDDLELIKRHYPELVGFVKKEMLSGWGSSALPTNFTRDEVTLYSRRKSSSTSSLIKKIMLVALISFISLFAIYAIKNPRFQDFTAFFEDPLLSQAAILYSDEYNVNFEAFMDKNAEKILQLIKEPKAYRRWLPYIRAVAYRRDGTWKTLGARDIKDNSTKNLAFDDCSLQYWADMWKKSETYWSAFSEGRKLYKSPWARVLVWDSFRIRSLPSQSWMEPSNYFEACMQMAVKALENFDLDSQKFQVNIFRSRLRWSMSLMNAQPLDAQFQMSGTLWALSCIDGARSEQEIRNCTSSMKFGKAWEKYLEFRSNLQTLRIQIDDSSRISPDKLNQIRSILASLSAIDSVTGFDYTPEIRFYSLLVELNGNLSEAKARIKLEQPDYYFNGNW